MAQTNQTDATDYMAAAGCFCLSARQAARKITRLYDSYLQNAGMRATQFTILSQLLLRGEMPIGRLATVLSMERTTLTRNLGLLEQKSWISIRPGDDPRSRMIAITAQGRAAVRRGFRFWSEAQAHVGRMLGDDGQAALKVLASRDIG
ncbi:MAG TPA: MarR family winged helix-turn-helix transcriptional regulator [Steroidobacteraceae bacterium]